MLLQLKTLLASERATRNTISLTSIRLFSVRPRARAQHLFDSEEIPKILDLLLEPFDPALVVR